MARADLYFHDPKPDNLNHWRPATAADFSGNGGQTGYGYGSPSLPSYTTANYSGAIADANTAQDLAAVPNRDRLTIQNLDSTDVLLVGIGEDAVLGRAYEIDPRGSIVIDVGEANQRISVRSAKAGLQFVAIGVIRT
ncbi:MAG: hypothetical protein ACRCZS_12645 [Chroococcidiopsis sp.]